MATVGGAELEIRGYRESDHEGVVALWRECGLVVPWNDPSRTSSESSMSSDICFSLDRCNPGWLRP